MDPVLLRKLAVRAAGIERAKADALGERRAVRAEAPAVGCGGEVLIIGELFCSAIVTSCFDSAMCGS